MATTIYKCPKCETHFALNDHIRCPNCGQRVPGTTDDLPKIFAGCTAFGCALPLLALYVVPMTYSHITSRYTRDPIYIAVTVLGWITVGLIVANLIRAFRRPKPPKSNEVGEP